MWTEQDRAIMRDIYTLLQRNAEPADTEAYWDALYDQGNDIMRRNPGSLLATNMVVAVWSHYESVIKASK